MSNKYCPIKGTTSTLHSCPACTGSSDSLSSRDSARLESLINNPGALSPAEVAEGERLYNQQRRSSR